MHVLLFIISTVFAGAVCRDGWVSSSSGSGTCSHHGGVAVWTSDYSPPPTAPRSVYYPNRSSLPTSSQAGSSSSSRSVYETVGSATAGHTTSAPAPEPLDTEYIRQKLVGFPQAGVAAIVVSEGDTCIVGLYERAAKGSLFSLASMSISGACKDRLNPGSVVEVLGDQVLVSPTESVKLYSLKSVTAKAGIPEQVTKPVPAIVDPGKVAPHLEGFPKAGPIAVVVAVGDSCVVGLYGLRDGNATYALATMSISGSCDSSLTPGSVVEVLGDQVLLSPTRNVKLYSLKVVSPAAPVPNAPAWAKH